MKIGLEQYQKTHTHTLSRGSSTGFERNPVLKEYVLGNGTETQESFGMPEDHFFCIFAGVKYRWTGKDSFQDFRHFKCISSSSCSGLKLRGCYNFFSLKIGGERREEERKMQAYSHLCKSSH